MGKIELMRMSELYAMTPRHTATEKVRQMYPGFVGCYCKLQINMLGLAGIRGAVIVYNGPLGCTADHRTFIGPYIQQYDGQPFVNIVSMRWTETEAVYGISQDQVTEYLRKVDERYKPDLIMICNACTAGVTGDDYGDMAQQAKKYVKAKILHLRTEGFSGSCFGDSIIPIWPEFFKLMDPPARKKEKAVNILGVRAEGYMPEARCNFPMDVDILAEYILKLGLEINSVIAGTAKQIFTAPEAALNTIYCHTWGWELALLMKEKYGVPVIEHGQQMGVTPTTWWIKDIGEHFGIQDKAEALIKEEYGKIEGLWNEAKRLLGGRYCIVDASRNTFASATKALRDSRFAMDLGMTPVVINCHPLEVRAKGVDIDYFSKYGCDPVVVQNRYEWGKPVHPLEVCSLLDVGPEEAVYIHNDVFPQGSPDWHPGRVPTFESTCHTHRRKGASPRSTGFSGAGQAARSLIYAFQRAKKGEIATLYARVNTTRAG